MSIKSIHRQCRFIAKLLSVCMLPIGRYIPKQVCEKVAYPTIYGTTSYYRCPRCRIPLNREYISFCDHCGQRLGWGWRRQGKPFRRNQ